MPEHTGICSLSFSTRQGISSKFRLSDAGWCGFWTLSRQYFFKKEKFDYELEVDNSVEKVDIKYELEFVIAGYKEFDQPYLNDVNKEFQKIGEIPDDTPISQKVMGWTGIQFNTINDTSNSKLSELLIQGYDMGIIKGVKLLNNSPEASKTVKNILNNFISLQEDSINSLKKFL